MRISDERTIYSADSVECNEYRVRSLRERVQNIDSKPLTARIRGNVTLTIFIATWVNYPFE